MPPGALRAEHIAEARAVAAARLPSPIAEAVLAVAELFVQVVLDLEVPRMVFGRACLLGDAAFVARPHAAAGTAKAADDAWALRHALAAHADDPPRRWPRGNPAVSPSGAACWRGRGRSGGARRSTAPGEPVIPN